MKKVCILTSGGDCPGMNTFIERILNSKIEVYGAIAGFKGLAEGNFIKLEGLSGIGSIGGTLIKSSRTFLSDELVEQSYRHFRDNNFDFLVVLGGNGSLKACKKLADKIEVIFVPATIDNDVEEMYSIGFDSAVNTVVKAIDSIRDSAKSHSRAFLIETMGRKNSAIAAKAHRASPDTRLLLENTDLDELSKEIAKDEYSLIIVPESVENIDKKIKILEEKSKREITKIVVGHLQRGGSPTASDRALASEYAELAIKEIE